jgi:hypothetical protein
MADRKRRKVVLVLGKQPENGGLSWEAGRQVRKATELLRSERWKDAILVLTGGKTVKGFPFTESDVFWSAFTEDIRRRAVREQTSTTTPENIRNARVILEGLGIEVDEMVVVSTWAHCLEVCFSTIPHFWRKVWWRTSYAPSPSGSWRGSRDHLGAMVLRIFDPHDRIFVPYMKRLLEGK